MSTYYVSNSRPYKCRVAYKSTLGVFVHRHQVMRVEQLIVHSRVRRELAPCQAFHVSKNDVLSTCKWRCHVYDNDFATVQLERHSVTQQLIIQIYLECWNTRLIRCSYWIERNILYYNFKLQFIGFCLTDGEGVKRGGGSFRWATRSLTLLSIVRLL